MYTFYICLLIKLLRVILLYYRECFIKDCRDFSPIRVLEFINHDSERGEIDTHR